MVSKIILMLDIICLIYWAADGIITLCALEKSLKNKIRMRTGYAFDILDYVAGRYNIGCFLRR